MRKISFFAGVVAVLVLIGLGTWIGVGTWTSTSALAGSTVDPLAMMTSAKGLPTSDYDDYSSGRICQLGQGSSVGYLKTRGWPCFHH